MILPIFVNIAFFLLLLLAFVPYVEPITLEEIPLFMRDITKNVKEIETYSSEEVYTILQKNFDRMQELHNIVDPHLKKEPLERAKEFSTIICSMHDDYAKIADMAPTIEQELRIRLENIKNLVMRAVPDQRELENTKNRLNKELTAASLLNDQQERAIREESLKQQIQLLEREHHAWKRLIDNQGEMVKRMADFSNVITKFIFVIRENSHVYERACRVAKLHENISEAMDFLYNDMENLRRMTDDLINNWTKLQVNIYDLMKVDDTKGTN